MSMIYTMEFGIGRIEFYHNKGNSLTSDMLTKMAAYIENAGVDPEVKALIIQSGGDAAFCGGASFDELKELNSVEEAKTFFMGFAQVLMRMRACPKLIICRVHGKCVGGGVGIAAASDLAFATKDAAIRLSELSIGIGPFVIGAAVERKIGTAAFSELTYLSTGWKNAYWAKEKGLFAEVFDTTQELDEVINNSLYEMIKYNPQAFAANKQMLWHQTTDWETLLEQRAETSAQLWMKKSRIKSGF